MTASEPLLEEGEVDRGALVGRSRGTRRKENARTPSRGFRAEDLHHEEAAEESRCDGCQDDLAGTSWFVAPAFARCPEPARLKAQHAVRNRIEIRDPLW
jgi:hypothetical protein